MSTTTAGCTIGLLLVTASLPAQVDGTPLPAQVGATASTCRDDEYWDPETGRCGVCVVCPQGMGSTVVECGNGIGAKGKCKECEEGKTFQDQLSTTGSCRPCAHCDAHATVLSNCTATQNTQCGPCQPGYGSHPGSSTFCSPCYLFNDNEKPPECLTTPEPTVTPSPSPPMQPTTTTSANGGSTAQNLPPNTIRTPEITTVLNVTNSTTSPGNASQSQLSFLAIPAVVLVLVLAIVLVVWILRQRGRKNTPPNTATLAELQALNKPETTADAQNEVVQDSAQPSSTSTDGDTSNHVVTIHGEGAQIRDPEIHTSGLHPLQDDHSVRSSNPVENASGLLTLTLPSGLPGENSSNHVALTLPSEEETQSSSPGIQGNGASPERDVSLASPADPVAGNPLHIPSQALTDGDATDANSHWHTPGSTNVDISPSIMPTIPEERNGPQGGSSRPTFNRQDSGKKQRILAKIPRIYKRSFSEPAGQKEGQAMPSPNSAAPLVLATTVREAVNKDKKDEEKKQFQKNFEKACSLGRNMQWTNLDSAVRRDVAQMLTPSNSNIGVCSFSHLGEELGLDRQTQLKPCNDINDVFDVLATQKEVPITMEEVLLKLKNLKRNDVLRKLVDGILSKNSNHHNR